MKTFTTAELKEVLRLHFDWLAGRAGGVRADLSSANLGSANLRYADLRSANLRSADLSSANLSYADLSSANLGSANLRYADLSYANLSSADLSSANLRSADLSYANLGSANLRYADLRSANLSYANLSYANLSSANLRYAKNVPERELIVKQIVPQVGAFSAYKKCREGLVALLEIPAKAQRVGGVISRKCRASEAKVIALYESKDKKSRKKTAHSCHNPKFAYTVGKTVKCEEGFAPSMMEECASGIHFFISYEEAEEYVI